MNRRAFVYGAIPAAFVTPLPAVGAQAGKVWRIGWLVAGSPTSHGLSLAAFRDGLQALGYVEGRNINIEYRWAEGNLDRLPELATELVQLKVDLIVAGGPGALAAKSVTRSIPIVMAGVGEVVETGLVASLARPGGNMTGFSFADPETAAKRLELLKEAMPQIKRVAVLWNSTLLHPRLEWKTAQRTATALGLTVVSHEARSLKELENAFITVPRTRPEGLVVLDDAFVFTYRKNIVEFASQARLPSVYGFVEFVTIGGLMSYGANIADTYRRAATYVDKILKGAKPGNLPVEQPTKFELIINLKTAKALGLTIPPALLLRADRVIE